MPPLLPLACNFTSAAQHSTAALAIQGYSPMQLELPPNIVLRRARFAAGARPPTVEARFRQQP